MIFRNIAFLLLLAACTSGSDNVAPAPLPRVQSRPIAAASEPEQQIQLNDQEFKAWLVGFKQRAILSGISKQTLDVSFANVELNERVVTLDKKQPEKSKITKEEYIANVINNARIIKAQKLLDENRDVLNKISARTGVEPQFIIALWGLESGFGANTGKFSIINSLSTLAYEGRRREFFEKELIAALKIIDQGHITADAMIGSWAGAMGQCQFMPSSFLNYAVDYDGDGRKDIWGTKEDVFASIANYLKTEGWGADKATKEKTLMHWNRSTYFVASVFILAESVK